MSQNKPNLGILINPQDNVMIAADDIRAGVLVKGDITTLCDIPQGHKIAIRDIPKGGEIIRYGVTLGYALMPVKKGEWINETMLELPVPPSIDSLPFATDISAALPEPPVRTFEGYRNKNGGYAGIRNILAIHTTVQCVTGILNPVVNRMKQELLPKYPNVDDIVPINHAYGCGVAINAPEAVIPIRALSNLVKHPNFGGQIMLVGLGCEKLTPDRMLAPEDNIPENVLILQEYNGYKAMEQAIMSMAENKLKVLDQRRRETLPLSELIIGLQCGGSDAFSGITANPSAGYASDMLVNAGATVLFSEVTEVRDGVHMLSGRTVNEETCKALVREMKWYDEYLEKGCVDRSANPSPGNKQGGLSNIVEKAMGNIVKSGTAPIVEVLSPGERPTKKGLIYAATPSSDIVCGPMQLASGISLQVFMTGRGTPYGLAAAPVIKVCSRTELKDRWPDLIDIDAGTIVSGGKNVSDVGTELFHTIIDIASGRKKPCAEQLKLYNDFCIFNPAPIT